MLASAELIKCLELGLLFGIVAIGIYLTFRVIDFPDLTCDGTFVLGSAVSAILVYKDVNPYIALILAIIAGGIAGCVTAILHSWLRVSSLLSGILVAFMLYSVNLDIMLGNPNIVLLGKHTIFQNCSPSYMLIAIVILLIFGLSYFLSTDFGLALKSIGQNKRLALNGGINVARFTLIGLALSNALVALGGALFTQVEGFGDITLGVGTIIFGLAAVMIGEKLLPYRHIAIALLACIAGSIIYRVLITLALHNEWIGLRTKDLNLVTGILVVLVMQVSVRGKANAYVRKSGDICSS